MDNGWLLLDGKMTETALFELVDVRRRGRRISKIFIITLLAERLAARLASELAG